MSDQGLGHLIHWMDTGVEFQGLLETNRNRYLYKCSQCQLCGNKLGVMVDKENLHIPSPQYHPAMIRFPDNQQHHCVTPDNCISDAVLFWLALLKEFEK